MHRITQIDQGESAVPSSSTPAVLVAEDSPNYRRLIERHLKQLDFDFVFARDERRHGALELQNSHDWHC